MKREYFENVVCPLMNDIIWEFGENPQLANSEHTKERLAELRDQIVSDLVALTQPKGEL